MMAQSLKHHVTRRVLEYMKKGGSSDCDNGKLASVLQLKNFPESKIGLLLSSDDAAQYCGGSSILKCLSLHDQFQADDIIQKISIIEKNKKQSYFFHLHQEKFIKHVLGNRAVQPAPSCDKRAIVEFSSPNIAKPFHVGHLRSTIIGNFISNLHEWFGYDVVRLNYLGDWGTQFGLVKVGMNILKPSSEELKKKPLSTLYRAYVSANAEAEKNPLVMDEARKIFLNLEMGKDDDILDWQLYKEYTVAELIKTYERLGIKFSAYSWESDYRAKSAVHILELLKSAGQLLMDKEGRSIVDVEGKSVPVLKSDGTTLYLTRDLAAAIDRQAKYKFDVMYYLADTSQHNHFKNLFHILKRLEFPWAKNLKHIQFGRIRGMSTRHGSAVFLNDILEEAHKLMLKQQSESRNTRVNLTEDLKTADTLGVSAIILADLIHKRKKDYTFNWDSARSITGNTGVRLQYTHCRLRSLLQRSGASPALLCDPQSLLEPTALNLVFEISRFDEVLQKSFDELEASRLAEYLFSLCDATNKALISLQVSNSGRVGEQRLLLFESARAVLHKGMTLIGLTPLDCM